MRSKCRALVSNRLLTVVLVFFSVLSVFLCVHVKQNFAIKIDYQRDFESPKETSWGATEGEVVLSNHAATLNFEGTSEKIYFYLFDQMKNPSSELAVVPESVSTIQFDCRLYLKPGLVVTAYIQQFDQEGNRIEEATEIERIETDTIIVDKESYRDFPYSIRARRSPSCVTYNVLFDIRPNGENGVFSVRDVDIIFK